MFRHTLLINRNTPYFYSKNINKPHEINEIKNTATKKLTTLIEKTTLLDLTTKSEELQLEFLKNNLKGYNLNINFFGIDKEVKLPFGNNLGKLNHDELKALYKKSHLGVVASLTNISLVNYEMMACGLPVIDYMEGSAPAFFTEEETIYINSQIDSIYNVVEKYLKEQNELNRIVKNGQDLYCKNIY